MQRVVSLLPSLTEIVHALGAGERLVGRSHECDFPPGVERLPALTEPAFEPQGTSRAIDSRVRELVEHGLAVYRVDAERLRGLAPELVLTQDTCAVCAASLEDVERAVAEWVGGSPRILSLAPERLADVWGDVRRVAEALDLSERGEELAGALEARGAKVGARSRSLPRIRVACLEWLDPLMTAGHWLPELVTLAGGEPLFGRPGARSETLAWEALREADPDALVVTPCGFDLARTRAELPALTERPGYETLRAVRAGRVYLADGNAYFNRSGPRLAESVEILAEMLHPEHFTFGYEGTAWGRP